MERFHYTISQKLTILHLVKTGQIFRLATQFPTVTQKQINDWSQNEEEMKRVPNEKKSTKLTLHKGPPLKYKELYHYLFLRVKELRSEKKAVTVDLLIVLAQEECEEVAELSHKGKISLIRRFMDLFKLSIREITGSCGFREEQASEQQIEERDSFIRNFKQLIIRENIPIGNVFNMDQTGIFYENPPTRTIDFTGMREIPVQTQNAEKKRLTLFSLMNAAGSLFKQMVIIKGVRNARIHSEITELNDENTLHSCQESAWTSHEVLEEWHSSVWAPIAEAHPGPKLLIIDAYPLHFDMTALFSQYQTTVLFIPAGLTFTLQPLDSGFFKTLKDEMKKLWILDKMASGATEKEKRAYISSKLKEAFHIMAAKNLYVYWEKAGLSYPYEEVEFNQRNFNRNFFSESSIVESNENTQMEIEDDNSQNLS